MMCLLSYGFVGLSIGLNSINQIGNDIRDYRQEGEIQRTRVELENSRQREAEMEARLRQLELAAQNNQLTQQQLMQLQMIQQQAQGKLQTAQKIHTHGLIKLIPLSTEVGIVAEEKCLEEWWEGQYGRVDRNLPSGRSLLIHYFKL